MWQVQAQFPSGAWDEPRCFANTEDAWRYMSSCARAGVEHFKVRWIPASDRAAVNS